jgi:osmotically-inducible protein OsmY
MVSTSSGELYSNIMDKLKYEPGLDASAIAIAIQANGVVVIEGKVQSYTEKRIVEESLKKIVGVAGVVNELEVIPSTISTWNDIDIAKAAIDALKWTNLVPNEQIKVTVEDGHLTLSGVVEYYFQKELVEKTVHDIIGVKSISNNIILKSDLSEKEAIINPTEVKQKITEEFERNAIIDARNIDVEVKGSEVILKGKVRNWMEKEEALHAAWSLPGVTYVNDQLAINWY